MGYINSRSTMKWWDRHTKKLIKFSFAKFDEHKNKFGRVWSPGSELMTGKNISTHPTLKIEPSDYPFIKYDIFEVNVNFPPIVTHIGIVLQYCKHHNMSYIFKSTKNIPWNQALPARNRTNVWIFRIGRKEPRTVRQVLEAVSSQQLTGKYIRVNFITDHRDRSIVRKIFKKIYLYSIKLYIYRQ